MRLIALIAFSLSVFPILCHGYQDRQAPERAGEASKPKMEEKLAEDLLMRSMQPLTEFGSVQVTVRGKTILLSGEVASPDVRTRAETLAMVILPGLFVSNQIAVGSEAVPEGEAVASEPGTEKPTSAQDRSNEARLSAIYQSVPALAGIQVAIEDGVVHLDGSALDQEAAERAEELASKMPGVMFVDNRVQVTHEVDRRLAPVINNTLDKLWGLWISLPLVLVALIIIGCWADGRWVGIGCTNW